MVVKTTKMSGYRSESCDISEATLQTESPKLVVSKGGPRRRAGKVGTYDVGAQSGGGELLVWLYDTVIYPAPK